MEKKFTAIVFTQDKKAVVADKYVPHAIYVQNKALVEKLGGEIIKDAGFRAEFKSVKAAKTFAAEAVTEISEKEYAASRKKPASKKKSQPSSRAPKVVATKTPARKSKKNAEITDEQKKVITALNVKLWNRIAAAYDRANGGSGAVNFSGLGKSKSELKDFVAAGIASLKKSKHWAKAEAVGVTEEMLG